MRVFVLNYNGGEKILKCLTSLTNQCLHVTLVDNASTDGSREEIERQFPNVEIVRMKQNIAAFAFNKALKEHREKWAYIWLGDIMATPGILDRLAVSTNSNTVLAISPLIYREGRGIEWNGTKVRFSFGHPRLDFTTNLIEQDFSPNTGLFNIEKFNELGGFDEVFFPTFYEDADLGMRAKARGWKCINCQSAMAIHDHDGTNRQTFPNIKPAILRNKEIFAQRHGSDFDRTLFGLTRPFWRFEKWLSE